MIADKNEAFSHNSCKKLAQLSKVIFAMTAQKQDRGDSCNELSNDFDGVISNMLQQHQYQLDLIFNSLYKYRKNCITSSCKEFGSSYKQTKIEFANFISNQGNKYNELMNEIKQIQKAIRTFQMAALQSAAKFLDFSEVVERDLKQKENASQVSAKAIRQHVRPILEKIVAYEDEQQFQFNIIAKEYRTKKENLKLQYSNDLKEIKTKTRPFLKQMKNNISVLRNETKTLKNDYSKIVKDHSEFSKKQLKIRNKIIADTNQTIRTIQRQIVQLSNRPNLKSYNTTLINKLMESRASNQIRFKQMYDQLVKESHRLKHQRHSLNRSKSSENSKRDKENLEFLKNQNIEFEKQKSKKMELHKYHCQLVDTALQDTERLNSILNQLIMKSIKNENSQSSYFLHGNEQQYNSTANNLKAILENVQLIINNYESEFNMILKKLTFDFSNVKEVISKLENDTKEFQKAHEKKIASKTRKTKHEIEEYQKTCDQRKNNRIEENVTLIKQKADLKSKSLKDFQSKFNKELQDKQKQIEKEYNEKISEFKVESTIININQELNDHKTDVTKLNAKINFWDQQVKQAKLLAEKKIEAFDKQINTLNKSRRQFERGVKTETQKIDENYEVKIQIRQVDLKDKMENISKLYTNEENVRGCDIIEGIRKVQEAQNRKLNLLLRKEREKEEMIKSQEKKISEIKQQINDFNNSVKNNQLYEEISKQKSTLNKIIFDLEKKRIEEVAKIKKEIEDKKKEYQRKESTISNQKNQENAKYHESKQQIIQQKEDLIEQAKQKTAVIDTEYQSKIERLNINHEKEIKALKTRIEFAKKSHEEFVAQCENDKTKLHENFETEISAKKTSHYNKFSFNEYGEIDQQILNLIKTKVNIASSKSPELIRKESESVILQLQKRAVMKTQNLSNEFNSHYENLKTIFEGPVEQETHHSIISGRKIASSLSQRVESSKNIILFESGSNKRIPQLVTPQLA
ncbi:hypothetical protein TRFO_12151 [Tritrichomonas foetus]|uniref:Uncharacterized protein n=1 Tax=Tritrichomonas foetus TaxID=1144522 RepID=A0A1J4IZY3_9EUKA|nr:hypothetical protein TRFO_12151 [Tritrichomonas foetus]|eukprot:OHS92966.1 hypothetical protein TRFO_12151 [Tritrichomonas foetus]